LSGINERPIYLRSESELYNTIRIKTTHVQSTSEPAIEPPAIAPNNGFRELWEAFEMEVADAVAVCEMLRSLTEAGCVMVGPTFKVDSNEVCIGMLVLVPVGTGVTVLDVLDSAATAITKGVGAPKAVEVVSKHSPAVRLIKLHRIASLGPKFSIHPDAEATIVRVIGSIGLVTTAPSTGAVITESATS